MSKIEPSDVYDVHPKTGALIIGMNQLDAYAATFLKKYCKEALEKPMPLPVEKMIVDAGLTIKTASLSKDFDIFGCCLLLDGNVDIYDPEKDEYISHFYPAGTLLFDPDSEWAYGEGFKRNTLIHEMIHWYKDETYFKICEQKKEQFSPIMCRQSRMNYEPSQGKKNQVNKKNQVQWLEWQANKLAPRVLMPIEPFRMKALELLSEENSCDNLVQALADFFIVSRISVKIRLMEVGLQARVSRLSDYEDVFAEINQTKDYVPISTTEAFQMLMENKSLSEWVNSRGFVFIDGYFVLPNKKNILCKDGQYHLSRSAKRNLPSCVINIQERRYYVYEHAREDISNFAVLYKTFSGVDHRILAFSPKMQSQFNKGLDDEEANKAYVAAFTNLMFTYNEEVEKELIRKTGDEDCSLCDCLYYLMEQRGWKNGYDFYDNTLLHENYYGLIRNNDERANKMKSDTLMAICVGLGLRLRLTEKVYSRSENKLHYYEEPDKTRIRIMEMYPGIGIKEFNKLLVTAKMEPLGSKERSSKRKC